MNKIRELKNWKKTIKNKASFCWLVIHGKYFIMKIKIILIILVSGLQFTSKAQWVTIPDAHFVAYLQANFPGCMNGNQMDTTCAAITGATAVTCISDSIADLTGIQYFDNLLNLDCEINLLSTLPNLPNTLIFLDCNMNQITILPSLPSTISGFSCFQNNLTTLPPLPNSLTHLSCGENQLTSLPTLPSLLNNLECAYNNLSGLPALPNFLQIMGCDHNLLDSLPALPDTLNSLTCAFNNLTSLPTLPRCLKVFICAVNNISCFPEFPDSLNFSPSGYVNIYNNPFHCLPNYVSGMDSLTLLYPLCMTGDTINNPDGCGVSNGIDKLVLEKEEFKIYPNPFSFEATISFGEEQRNTTIKIIDVIGEEIKTLNFSGKQLIIEKGNIKEGIYFVQVIDERKNVRNKKIVIQ